MWWKNTGKGLYADRDTVLGYDRKNHTRECPIADFRCAAAETDDRMRRDQGGSDRCNIFPHRSRKNKEGGLNHERDDRIDIDVFGRRDYTQNRDF